MKLELLGESEIFLSFKSIELKTSTPMIMKIIKVRETYIQVQADENMLLETINYIQSETLNIQGLAKYFGIHNSED